MFIKIKRIVRIQTSQNNGCLYLNFIVLPITYHKRLFVEKRYKTKIIKRKILFFLVENNFLNNILVFLTVKNVKMFLKYLMVFFMMKIGSTIQCYVNKKRFFNLPVNVSLLN